MDISITILTKNNSQTISRTLNSLLDFDEVLIYDNGSSDATIETARKFKNVKVIEGPFLGFGPTHNLASSLTKHDWILSLDSDEVLSMELVSEIQNLVKDPDTVYSFPRHNYYREKFIRGCGWYPDRQFRLYNRNCTKFTSVEVHEQIIVDGCIHVPLNHPIIHYSYTSIEDFLQKMQVYSTLFAKEHCGKKKSSPMKAILHGAYAFIKTFIIKRGFIDGYEGLLISSYNAHTSYYKYMKLYEANKLLI